MARKQTKAPPPMSLIEPHELEQLRSRMRNLETKQLKFQDGLTEVTGNQKIHEGVCSERYANIFTSLERQEAAVTKLTEDVYHAIGNTDRKILTASVYINIALAGGVVGLIVYIFTSMISKT